MTFIFVSIKTLNHTTSLSYIYDNYGGTHAFDHWKEYATKYDFHLQQLFDKMPKTGLFRMLEIGVQSGGSVEVWKSFFSQRPFYYVGMDIDERCKRSEDVSQNIFIEIGSQLSVQDLLQICKKHGPFDIIVDDGGHTSTMMNTSLCTLFPSDLCMAPNSLYVIEDMHTMMFKGYSKHLMDIPNMAAEIFHKMHYYWSSSGMVDHNFVKSQHSPDKEWADRVESISLYNSMMFIHRGYGNGRLTRIIGGKDGFPYRSIPVVPF